MVEHHGIRIELVGEIELPIDQGGRTEFRNLLTALLAPGQLSTARTVVPFEFKSVDAPFESYDGQLIRLR